MSRTAKLLFIALLAFFAVTLFRTAWVGDDVYITLRTVDNFVNGYGLRWNVAERVQSYTHPLWLLAMLPAYALSRDGYFTALFVSLLFTALTLLVVIRRPNFLIGLVILLSSKAFMDFSVSGLENPATHLLLAIFIVLFWTKDEPDLRLMGLIAALVILNRMDAALFLAPALCYLFYKRPTLSSVARLALGFSPFILWEVFSLFYYGFLFPNTAYAKLGTGISGLDLMRQGLVYYLDSLTRDPLTLLVIVFSLTLAFWQGQVKERLAAAGVALYLLYILTIGGDFMSGRFFSAPLLVSTLLMLRALEIKSSSTKTVVAVVALLIGFLAPYPTLFVNTKQIAFTDQDIQIGINDERAYYYQKTGLLTVWNSNWASFTKRGWAEHGLTLRANGRTVVEEKNVGFTGYFAGPQVYIVDTYALCDPLLARLPALEQTQFRIGHFERAIPDGYIQTIKTGANRLKDPNLAQFYDQLTLITRAPLWDAERLRAIWEMNTGQYNHLLSGGAK